MILLRSYATLSELFNDLFHTHIALPVYSFGFFVALAFIMASWVLYAELRRKSREGIFIPQKASFIVGKPATASELIINGLIGLVIGYKIGGMVTSWHAFNSDPQHFIFSMQGNIIGGIIGGLLLLFLKWQEKNKQRLQKPETRTREIYPYHRVGDFVTLAAIFGILGAKVFSNFEEPNGWHDFLANPLQNFFSGLTIYGGLLFGAAAIIIYARNKKIPILPLGDAVAPALILAYGIGRIGCQVAGDGDWGILNSAYITMPDATVAAAGPGDVDSVIQANSQYYTEEFNDLDKVPKRTFHAPSFLPVKLVAETYAHNVNNEGEFIEGCNGNWCAQLPVPVFPTPIYETFMSLVIFGLLWLLRSKLKIPGMILGLYVLCNGIERFLIEQIRVNHVLVFLGIHATQATFISFVFTLFGIGFMIFLVLRKRRTAKAA